MAVSVASPTMRVPPSPSGSTVALLASASLPSRSSSATPSTGPSTATGTLAGRSGEAAHMRRMVMRFCVRVPVLSEQMTETEPSVSTAGSLRTSACFWTMLWTPWVSVRVTMSCRVSGTAATARLTAASTMAQNSSPCCRPVARRIAAATMATALMARTTRTSRSWSGVCIFWASLR